MVSILLMFSLEQAEPHAVRAEFSVLAAAVSKQLLVKL